MFPLSLTLALSLLSLLTSLFIVLRIVIPALPPSPLSRKASPSEFGLPNFRRLTPSDKGLIWIASTNIIGVATLVWQTISERVGGPDAYAADGSPILAARIWVALSLTPTCLLIALVLSLMSIRNGRSISFGPKHIYLCVPLMLVTGIACAASTVAASRHIDSLYFGVIGYSLAAAVLSSASLGFLAYTLKKIKRNLSLTGHGPRWPTDTEKSRPSFAAHDIDAIREGSSWITSDAASNADTLSAFSFSTHRTGRSAGGSVRKPHPATASYPSVVQPSSFWFQPLNNDSTAEIPPVPRLPSPYRDATTPTAVSYGQEEDPFRKDLPQTEYIHRGYKGSGSQNSWLTSEAESQATPTAFSYPTTIPRDAASDEEAESFHDAAESPHSCRPPTPAMADAQVLGGYGRPMPSDLELADSGLSVLSVKKAQDLEVSPWLLVSWLAIIWVPAGLSLPYFATAHTASLESLKVFSILLTLGTCSTSPLIALLVILKSGLPIPAHLFEARRPKLGSSETLMKSASTPSTAVSSNYKRSVTVVEGKRSTDVWLEKGEAVDGQSRLSRALSMLAPKPKLSMLPLPDSEADNITSDMEPPKCIRDETFSTVHQTLQSVNSMELGRRGHTRLSRSTGTLEGTLSNPRVSQVTEKLRSAIGHAVLLSSNTPKSSVQPNREVTGLVKRHGKSLSVSSVSGPRSPISPPPSSPLPPTPPRQVAHQRSHSSGFSFGPINNANEIDALSAGVLPLLVPGLRIGSDVKISSSSGRSPRTKRFPAQGKASTIGFSSTSFSSPDNHSTPLRVRKTSNHKRNHFSLPSLSFGKDGYSLSSWKDEIHRLWETKTQEVTEDGRRHTVWGVESTSRNRPALKAVAEHPELQGRVNPHGFDSHGTCETRSSEFPLDVNSQRSSMATLIEAVENHMSDTAGSLTSTDALFAGKNSSGPLAQSTPGPTDHPFDATSSKVRKVAARSSVTYIKADGTSLRQMKPATNKAIRSAKPKSDKLESKHTGQRNMPHHRPLALLQNRDMNQVNTAASDSPSVRPLVIGKKNSPSGIRPLQLARSASAKIRRAMRENQGVPKVVVRPPSTANETRHSIYAY